MTLFKQSALAAAVCLALAPAAFAQQTSGSSSTPAADTGASSTSNMGSTATPSSDEVRQVQQHLKDKGQDVGAVDGVMGPKTRSALKNFQQQQGLTASGDIDASTRRAVGVEGGGSTRDSRSPPAGGTAPGATGGSSSTSPSGGTSSTPSGATGGTSSSPSNATGGSSSSSTSPSGGTGSISSSPSDSGTSGSSSSGTMPKK
jgi:peptidoglycan hydrolase-like protein with peptidoglycan-binding domain